MAVILVTGGAGYVGAVCCSQLVERGHRVSVVDDLSAGHAAAVPPGARLHIVDIGNRLAMREVFASDDFDLVSFSIPMLLLVLHCSRRLARQALRDSCSHLPPPCMETPSACLSLRSISRILSILMARLNSCWNVR